MLFYLWLCPNDWNTPPFPSQQMVSWFTLETEQWFVPRDCAVFEKMKLLRTVESVNFYIKSKRLLCYIPLRPKKNIRPCHLKHKKIAKKRKGEKRVVEKKRLFTGQLEILIHVSTVWSFFFFYIMLTKILSNPISSSRSQKVCSHTGSRTREWKPGILTAIYGTTSKEKNSSKWSALIYTNALRTGGSVIIKNSTMESLQSFLLIISSYMYPLITVSFCLFRIIFTYFFYYSY